MPFGFSHCRLSLVFVATALWAHLAWAVSPQHSDSLIIGHNDSRMSLYQGAYSPSIPLAFSGKANQDNQLSTADSDQYNITGLVRLTNPNNLDGLATNSIAYVSCDPGDYDTQLLQPSTFLTSVLSHLGPLPPSNTGGAVILYSKSSDWCSLDTMENNGIIFTMISSNISTMLYNSLSNRTYPNQTSWIANMLYASRNGTFSGASPSLASPTTTIAMIVLYSVTGVITFLFLLIIVLGAVRAHRHPERYGPRNILGMPRQSRARGMARALLDTIPIVKFGENEPPKPRDGAQDVELGPRNADGTSETMTSAGASVVPDPTVGGVQEGVSDSTTNRQMGGGVVPASDLTSKLADVPGANTVHVEPSAMDDPRPDDDSVQCPICTEDFVRGEPARPLPCDHHFHPACIDPWLLNVSSTCPLCRVDLNPPEQGSQPVEQNQQPAVTRRSRLSRLGFLDMRGASREERIQALRQVREERRSREGGGDEGSRRSRLSHLFHRNRQPHVVDDSVNQTVPSPSSDAAQQAEDGTTHTNDEHMITSA